MKKRKMIGFLMSISLCMSSYLIVQAEDYVGPEYDENGFLMSPDELNADKPESTYYEDLEKSLTEEEESDTSTESDIEYHSEDEPSEATRSHVILESYPSTDETPEVDNNVSTFYAYKKETPIHFSKLSTCGGLFSANLPLLLHILETIL
ncbi:MAG: hypothetical protein Q4C84_01280 [Bacillota bacterium]|nr:hypothetical protein [Bacillota bacterium]